MTLQLLRRDGHQLLDAGAGLVIDRVIGCRHEPSDDELPYVVEIWATYSEASGRYEVDSVQALRIAGGPPVTADALRSIPIAALLQGLIQRGVSLRAVSPTEVQAPFVMPDARLPRKLDDEAYREIGLVHRLHEVLGNRATTSTAEHYGVTTTTVHNWLREARARGLLEPVWSSPPSTNGGHLIDSPA